MLKRGDPRTLGSPKHGVVAAMKAYLGPAPDSGTSLELSVNWTVSSAPNPPGAISGWLVGEGGAVGDRRGQMGTDGSELGLGQEHLGDNILSRSSIISGVSGHCVQFPFLSFVVWKLPGTQLCLGAQNLWHGALVLVPSHP